jgi:hypothetical protein
MDSDKKQKVKKGYESGTETVILSMRATDYFWCFLGAMFLIISGIICYYISQQRKMMMDPDTFKPEWFINS